MKERNFGYGESLYLESALDLVDDFIDKENSDCPLIRHFLRRFIRFLYDEGFEVDQVSNFNRDEKEKDVEN